DGREQSLANQPIRMSIQTNDGTAGQFDRDCCRPPGVLVVDWQIDGDKGFAIGSHLPESFSPLIERGDAAALGSTKFSDGHPGSIKTSESVPPLLGELRIGKCVHGFLLKVETNPSPYPPRQHGQIERLRFWTGPGGDAADENWVAVVGQQRFVVSVLSTQVGEADWFFGVDTGRQCAIAHHHIMPKSPSPVSS